MADPASALRHVGGMLAKKGFVVIRVPYIGWFLEMKRVISWLPVQFGAPRHLYDFSPRTLRLILERNGYHVERLCVGSRERVSTPAAAAGVGWHRSVGRSWR